MGVDDLDNVKPDPEDVTSKSKSKTTKKSVPKSKATSKSELANVAKEALAGDWGVGQERRRRLSEAGYDPNEVQAEIIRLKNPQ